MKSNAVAHDEPQIEDAAILGPDLMVPAQIPCADWQDKDNYSRSPERNPAGPDHGVHRAARGGAWRQARTICRATLRSKLDPSFRHNDFGFRLARSL